ncbi:hypothetical protein [Yinghuangia sp. YIM S09857]|uniref:hypothetical protein n=1 Tax=Yinghuangia sp. YIM S09857 TaxID=3436929 RepID=UPI003F52DCE6
MGEVPDRVDPTGIPTYTGYLGQLELDHAALTGDAEAFRGIGESVHTRFQGLASCYKAPEAEQLFATTETVMTRADSFADELATVGGTLSEYFEAIRPLVTRLNQLRADAEAFVSAISDDDEWTYDEAKVAENNAYIADIATVVGQFWEAERNAANKILALFSCKQWTADDGSGADSMYGFKPEDMAQAQETPWGKTVTEDHYWDEFGYHLKSFFWDGIVVEGLWGTLTGLATLANPLDDDCGAAWEGVGKLAVGLCILWTPGLLAKVTTMPDGPLKDYMDESLVITGEFGKSLIAWDDWSENPGKAAGVVTFNVVTALASFGGGTAAEGAGLTARAVSTLAKIGEIVDPMTYVGKGIGAGLRGIGSIGELTVKLTDFDAFKGIELPNGGFVLPDGTTLVPELPPDGTVKLPDGSLLHPDGTLEFPEGAKQPDDEVPAEMSGDDLRPLDETSEADDGDLADLPDGTPPVHVPADTPPLVAVGADQAPYSTGDNLGDLPPSAALPGTGTPRVPGGATPAGPVDTSPFGPTPQPWPRPGTQFDSPGGGPADVPRPGGWFDGPSGHTDPPGGHDLPDGRLPTALDGNGIPDDPGHLGDDLPTGGGDGPPPPPPTRPTPPGPALPDPPQIRDLMGKDLSPAHLIPEIQRGVDGTFGSGEYTVRVTTARSTGNTVTWRAEILDRNGANIGHMVRDFHLERNDKMFVKHDTLWLKEKFRGKGFGTEFSLHLENWYRSSGVQRIELQTGSVNGGYTWAKAGYNFENSGQAEGVFRDLSRALKTMNPPPTRVEYDAVMDLLKRARESKYQGEGCPWPSEIAAIDGGTEFGKRFLSLPGVGWRGVKFL